MDHVGASYFLQELHNVANFPNSELMVLRRGFWFNANSGEPVSDEKLLAVLNEKPKNGFLKYVTATASAGFFWLAKNHAVVRIDIKRKTRISTLMKLHSELDGVLKIANHIFAANHDSLTGLLNRNGVKLGLERHLQFLLETGDEVELELEQSPARAKEIAVLGFDIDHFKQVNDAFGHGVGDVVLKIFATRLKSAVKEIESIFSCIFILSRPGGEEFELIVIGEVGRDQLKSISDTILKFIRQPLSSSVAEINEYGASLEIFPQRILASIGIAKKSILNDVQNIEEIVEGVRKMADLALFRAKSDGRDCVRYFEDIKRNHGRVMEYYGDSDLVVIDIGGAVSVRLGDVFSVYFPPFTGDSDCVVDDGRTKKRLGSYAAVESARIRVLNIQESISTCFVVSRQNDSPIPVGSLLKSVSMGSKPMAVEPRRLGSLVKGRAQLLETLQKLLPRLSLFGVINLLPRFTEKDSENRSQLLGDYITAVHLIFPAGSDIFCGDGENFYVIVKLPEASAASETAAKEYIKSLIEKLDEHAKSRVGVFLGVLIQDIDISINAVLHFAKAALVATARPISSGSAINFFNPAETLSVWKNRGRIDEVIADYQSFKSYGIVDPFMENQFGLAILAANDAEKFRFAEIAFVAAHNHSPNRIAFAANAALIKSRLGKFQEAYEIFTSIDASFFERSKSSNYFVAFVKSAFELFKINRVDAENMRDLINRLFVAGPAPIVKAHPVYGSWVTELSKAGMRD